jgi:hypothetical protein
MTALQRTDAMSLKIIGGLEGSSLEPDVGRGRQKGYESE